MEEHLFISFIFTWYTIMNNSISINVDQFIFMWLLYLSLHKMHPLHLLFHLYWPLQFEAKAGGKLNWMRKSLKFFGPPEHIPTKIEVDMSNLDIGDRVLMSEVEVHPSLKLLSKNESIPIFKIASTETPDHNSTKKTSAPPILPVES